MKALPPCKKNGVDCPKRTATCHSECPEYADYEKAHAREVEEQNRKKKMFQDANGFLSEQHQRALLDNTRKSEYRFRHGLKTIGPNKRGGE